jgi:hypothetical protein
MYLLQGTLTTFRAARPSVRNYSGSQATSQAFSQLQPVTDFSNALYPVQGNPNLSPEFANNFTQIRYNQFSFATGDVLFLNFDFIPNR